MAIDMPQWILKKRRKNFSKKNIKYISKKEILFSLNNHLQAACLNTENILTLKQQLPNVNERRSLLGRNMRFLSFSSEKRHMKHSCLHVQTREKIQQQLRFVESYNCHSLYCENCYHSVVVVQLLLPPPARFTCSLKFQSK